MPHEHHSEMTDEEHLAEHREADNLLDWLRLSFHSDFGEGHLENFISSDGHFVDLNPSIVTGLFPASTLFEVVPESEMSFQKAPKFHLPPILLTSTLTSTQSLRGPPLT